MNFQIVSLGDLLTLVRRKEIVELDKQYPEVGVYCFGRGLFHKEPRSGLEVGNKPLFKIEVDDFIFQTTFAWEGAVALATKNDEGFFGSIRVLTFRVDQNKCLPNFLVNYFKTPEGVEQLGRISPGSAGRNRVLGVKRIHEVMVPLPPLSGQRRIIAKIERLAAKIEEAKKLRIKSSAETDRLQKALFQNAEKSASRFGVLKSIQSVIKSHDSGWSPRCLNSPAQKNHWGILKTTAIQWNEFVPYENKAIGIDLEPRRDKAVHDGDVLITRAGPANRVGIACFVRNPPDKLMLSDKIVRLVPSEKIYPEFLTLMLASPSAQEYFRQGKTGLAASQVNITRKKLLSLEIPVPPEDEQRRIVRYLTNLQSKVAHLKTFQAKTAADIGAMIPSILDKAFKGEL